MRSRAKQGQRTPRNRTLRSVASVLRRVAVQARIKLEQEARAEAGVSHRRLEEGEALALYRKLPSVAQIARDMAGKISIGGAA